MLSLGARSSNVITPLVPVSSQRRPVPGVVSTQSESSQRLMPPRASTAAPIHPGSTSCVTANVNGETYTALIRYSAKLLVDRSAKFQRCSYPAVSFSVGRIIRVQTRLPSLSTPCSARGRCCLSVVALTASTRSCSCQNRRSAFRHHALAPRQPPGACGRCGKVQVSQVTLSRTGIDTNICWRPI